MAGRKFLYTSESVTEGHPDKIADHVSDGVLDAMLAQDPASRVACETMITTGLIVVAGEITSQAVVDIQDVARKTVARIGYDHSDKGFDANTCGVLVALDKQSPDISQGVTAGKGLFKEQGAGDQGLMYGFATKETKELMPAPIYFAHRLVEKLSKVRRNKKLPFLLPDGKSQVTFEYHDGVPTRVDAVVISSHHTRDAKHKEIKEGVIEEVIKKTIPARFIDKKTKFYVNPTGRFVVGGPMGDCGLTGRKIIVDTYGGMGRHGGGAFSGKDPSKVDRSACYMARHVAKTIVAAGLADRCEVQVAYAIGVAQPVSVRVDAQGTEKVEEVAIERAVRQVFDLRPAALIEHLDLLRPIFQPTAAYGHFGRTGKDFTWESTKMAAKLKKAVK